jgi:glycosyltransferase involved in cell wall biosynthesis
LRWLFVKERMAWPRASGHDVHTYHVMRALARHGQSVALATVSPIPPDAVADGGLECEYCFEERTPPVPDDGNFPITLSKAQEKFRNYWGVEPARIRWIAAAAADFRADVVVVSGLRMLPYLGALPVETKKVWYAADEWVWHHFSQFRPLRKSTWCEIKPALVKGLYERVYRRLLDRVWVVSNADARAFRWFAGIRKVDVLPNGVDAEYFALGGEVPSPNSCVFWGRLDFGPNIQAVEWFTRRVWPKVRAAVPGAKFQLIGFQPTAAIRSLAGKDGIELEADLPDLRSAVRGHTVAVLPFVSGGGIKNKLLEAAALGMPILASPKALNGLKGSPPFPVLRSPAEWAERLASLWRDRVECERLGRAARAWVTEHHTWDLAARTALAGLGERIDEARTMCEMR